MILCANSALWGISSFATYSFLEEEVLILNGSVPLKGISSLGTPCQPSLFVLGDEQMNG